jgi:hypothetical protein
MCSGYVRWSLSRLVRVIDRLPTTLFASGPLGQALRFLGSAQPHGLLFSLPPFRATRSIAFTPTTSTLRVRSLSRAQLLGLLLSSTLRLSSPHPYLLLSSLPLRPPCGVTLTLPMATLLLRSLRRRPICCFSSAQPLGLLLSCSFRLRSLPLRPPCGVTLTPATSTLLLCSLRSRGLSSTSFLLPFGDDCGQLLLRTGVEPDLETGGGGVATDSRLLRGLPTSITGAVSRGDPQRPRLLTRHL